MVKNLGNVTFDDVPVTHLHDDREDLTSAIVYVVDVDDDVATDLAIRRKQDQDAFNRRGSLRSINPSSQQVFFFF